MKKLVCILMAALMVASVGCGGGKEEIKPNTPNVGETAGKVEIPEETEPETTAPALELTIAPDGMDIVDVSRDHVAAVCKDGTVVAAGMVNEYNECDVATWTDVVKVRTVYGATFGLKKDGTMLVNGDALDASDDRHGVLEWTNLVDFDVKDHNIVGLKSDGTVVGFKNGKTPSVYQEWKDVVRVAASKMVTLAVTADGNVLYYGDKGGSYDEEMITAWTDIVDIDICADGVVGLKKDGTVLTAYKKEIDTSSWQNVIAVAAHEYHVMALSSDGTIYSDNVDLVEGWNNMVGGASEDLMHIGVRTDGTVIVKSLMGNSVTAACHSWTNIGIPE